MVTYESLAQIVNNAALSHGYKAQLRPLIMQRAMCERACLCFSSHLFLRDNVTIMHASSSSGSRRQQENHYLEYSIPFLDAETVRSPYETSACS